MIARGERLGCGWGRGSPPPEVPQLTTVGASAATLVPAAETVPAANLGSRDCIEKLMFSQSANFGPFHVNRRSKLYANQVISSLVSSLQGRSGGRTAGPAGGGSLRWAWRRWR